MAKKTYEAAPEVPAALRQRYETMLSVLRGQLTVSDGARSWGCPGTTSRPCSTACRRGC